ncbi:DNRLRE domain-containing protein [Micromonospora echinaurantiaca]|uniref:DNRLRE domain-containing protein n=1 Tax=Micromonospora echinaurantiaca TaxID=47857 RepID=UPI00371A91C9
MRRRRGASRSRRGIAAVLACLLVLSLLPASSVIGPPGGTGNPVSWLAARLNGLKDVLTGSGPEDRQGELRAGPNWAPPGRAALVAQEKPKPPGKRVKEITRERTATRTVYQLDDGRLQTELSSVPVRYRDHSGAWRDIDTRVAPVRDDGYRYGNDGTGFATRFGDRSDALLKVQLGDRWLTIGVAGPARRVSPTVKGSTVTYAGMWDGADLVYDVTPTGVKESIVLSKAPAAAPSYDFALRTAGLTTQTLPDGSVGFFATGKQATGSPVFTFPKPFMIDARSDAASPHGHAYSDKVAMTTTGSGATSTISLKPDQGWLAAEERQYPVVLDPTISVQPDVTTARDAMIVSYGATSNYEGDPRLGVGVDQWGKVRSLLAFDLTGVVPAGTPVDAADLSLYWDNTVLAGTSASTPVGLEARAVTQAWTPSTVTWNSINAAMGDLAGTATYQSSKTNSWTSFPVTGMVREWVAGTRPNHGFMLKAANEAQAAGGPVFWAGEFPVAPAGAWPTYTTRTAPKLTLTFGLPAVTLADVQTVRATGAELSWAEYVDPSTASGDDLVEYQVHRGATADFAPAAATLVAPVPAGTTSYADSTATPDTTLYYRVVVVRKDGQRSASRAVAVQTPPAGYVDAMLPTVADTTLTACQYTQPHDLLNGRPMVGVGYVPGGAGITRALLKWDTSQIPATARITQAEGRLWRTLHNGNAAYFATHAVTRPWDEATATWLNATASTRWTYAGGDAVSAPIQVVGLGPTLNSVWVNVDLTSQVQAWRTNPAANHGILVRVTQEPNKACPGNGEGATFVSAEGAEPSVQPRLHVRYTDTTVTYHAAATPPRLNPGETVTVPVTVTNTTSETWPASSTRLGYWWKNPDGTDASTPDNQLFSTLPADLAAGQTVTVNAQVKAPALSGVGNKAEAYTLAWDLYDTSTNNWKSASSQLPQLPQQIRVEDPTSDLLGLEKFYAYTGKSTGGGGTLMTNLYAGNTVWSYNAFSNPSRGPHTFVRMNYNSLDTSASSMGFGWSLQTSTIQRLGSQLSFHPPGQKWPSQVRLTDGDGTTNVWVLDTHGRDVKDCTPSTCDYTHPRGVHLYLQQTGSGDATRAWVFTKPDRTQFFFDEDGFQSAIVDKNGNTMSFVYERRKSNNKPTKFLRYITDATGRRTLTLDYYDKGDSYRYIDDDTWQEVAADNLTNPFIIDNVRSVTDIAGRTITFTYTGKGLMAKMIDGAGSAQPKVFGFRYDATQGNKNVKLIKVTDPRNHDTHLSYYTAPVDPQNKWKLQDLTDRIDGVTHFDYVDPDGPQGGKIHATATDPLQHDTRFVLDAYGRPESVTNAKNQSVAVQWDGDHNVTRLTDAKGGYQTWDYDPKTGYPLTVRTAEANKNGWPGTRLSYRTSLNGYVADLIEKSSPEGRTWRFDYDVKGNLRTVTDPVGTTTADPVDYTTSYDYDSAGQLTRVTDANGHTTDHDLFDPNGYPRTITDHLGNVTTFGYDARGRVTQVTDALGTKTTQTYDVFGRPLERTVPKDQDAGDVVTTPAPEYDPNDNILKAFAPNGTVSEAEFDAADRVTFILAPKDEPDDPERKTSYTYDAVGNQLTVTEPKGNLTPTAGDYTTTNTYNEIYQLVTVTSANGDKITSSYDEVGNITMVVDPRKNATEDPDDFTEKRAYDLDHRITTVTDAAGHTRSTEYDRDGLAVATVDQEGNRSTVRYNERGDVIEQKVPYRNDNGTIVHNTTQYHYDEVGNRTKVVTPRGVATATADDFTYQTVYDELNRVKEQWTAYDPNDSRYNKPDKTIYEYDPVGRLATVSAPPSSGESVRNDTTYTYWDNGWTKSTTDPWDIVTTYDYNLLGQQTENTLTSAGGSVSRTMRWDFYPSGNLKARSDEGVPVGQQAVLVDNSDFNNTSSAGTWPAATAGTFQGYDYRTNGAGTGAETFTWDLVIPQDGDYDVYVRYPAVSGAASNAPVTVDHAGGSATTRVDQTAGAGTWVKVGRYGFTAAGTNQKVTLTDDANGTVVADAVKLVRDNSADVDNEKKNFTYRYDPNGNLVEVTDLSPDARVDSYVTSYDGLNRVSTVEELVDGGVRNRTAFTYDPNANVETRTHDATWSRFEYDVRDLLSTVTNAASASATDKRITTYRHTPRGQVEHQVKPNGNTVDFDYYLNGAIRHQVEKRAGGAVVAEHTLEYTANGDPARDVARVMNADDSTAYVDNTYTFNYDPQDRIARVDKTGANPTVESYVHDANSNVITQTVKDVTTNHNYDRNRLMTSTAVGGLTSKYNYDPLGRLDTVSTGGQVTEKYRYDGFDRIAELRSGAGTAAKTTRYVYDPFDRTAAQTTNAGGTGEKTTTFTYLGTSGDVLYEEVAGKVTKSYEYSAWGKKLTQLKKKDDGATEISHYTYHPKGDVEAITKHEDGTTRATYGYTAYGDNDDNKFTGADKPDAQNPDAEPYNAYRFNGHRWDQASGTYDMGFRNYDPGLNRFLSRDMYNGALDDLTLAIDPFSGSRYAFAGGNPISNVELDGHGFFDSVKSFASGVVDHIKEDPLQFLGEVAVGVGVALAVGAVCSTGVGCVILAGAAAGAASAAYGYGTDVAQGEHSWDWGDFGKNVLIGGVVGAATAGIGKGIKGGWNKIRGKGGNPSAPPAQGTPAPHAGAPEPTSAPAPPAAAPAPAPARPATVPSTRGAAGNRPPVVEVQPPSPGLTQAESLAQLERRLPAFALFSRTAATSSRTYVGALNTRTGQTALASSGGMPGCSAYCAEGNALLALGGNPSEVLFTGAVTVRRSAQGALEAVPMPVCVKCQLDYPRSNFLPGVRGAPGGSWGG